MTEEAHLAKELQELEALEAGDPTLKEGLQSYYKSIETFKKNDKRWEDETWMGYMTKEKTYRDRVLRNAYEKVKFREKTQELNAEIKNF